MSMSKFERALEKNIKRFVSRAGRDSLVGMSVANLRQVVPTPSAELDGAPRGTNAPYYYAEMFARVARATCPAFLID
jgi:hypothetical protein